MHLAILVTNNDRSALAQRHPFDTEKFRSLIHMVRPDWQVTGFEVHEDAFPADVTGFDGVIITGSPASVRSGAAWVERLLGVILQADAAELPMFGACFGHQAIALALGGEVGANPGGWQHGLVHVQAVAPVPWSVAPDQTRLYASHSEQVLRAPEGVTVIAKGPDCPVGGFVKGRHVMTSQYHPEITPDFMADLVDWVAEEVGPEVTARARASMVEAPTQAVFAEELARFFEQARG